MSTKLDKVRGHIDLAYDVIEQSVAAMTKRMFGCDPNRWGCCIPWSMSGFILETIYGFRVTPVAGSVYMKANNDPEPLPTHFSTVYTEGAPGIVVNGIESLPEVHSWLYLIDMDVMVDFSVRYAKQFALSAGLNWDQPSVDGVLVFDSKTGEGLPEGWRYETSRSATKLVLAKARELIIVQRSALIADLVLKARTSN